MRLICLIWDKNKCSIYDGHKEKRSDLFCVSVTKYRKVLVWAWQTETDCLDIIIWQGTWLYHVSFKEEERNFKQNHVKRYYEVCVSITVTQALINNIVLTKHISTANAKFKCLLFFLIAKDKTPIKL